METQKRFSIQNYLVVLFALGLLFSCEQLAPVEEPVDLLEEFQNLSGLALEPEDDPIDARLVYSSDCESDCIEPGSGNYFAIRDSKSQSSGINTKKVSYKAYNTEDKFVVKVKYEITSGPSQAKPSIAIMINRKKKEFKTVPSGYTATFSIPLEKGWEKCDQVTFSIVQKGLGSPISFSEDYNLISVCETGDTFTDPRDGQVYKIVRIGNQVWFAENLNYEVDGSWCYDDNPLNCGIYGRLYNWRTALTACPEGWRLPSTQDWRELIGFLGGEEVAHIKMTKVGAWSSELWVPTNESGFSGLPAGTRGSGGLFFEVEQSTWWWESREDQELDAWFREIHYDDHIIDWDSKGKEAANSCRCIQNGEFKVGQEYGGGIIAYILQSGDPGYDANKTHGIIAARRDQSEGIQWYNGSYILTGATGTGLGTGQANTTAILNSQGPGSYAAQLCNDLELNGYEDWYLPSKDELNKLYLNRADIGSFVGAFYSSSSEESKFNAWTQDFFNGNQFFNLKLSQNVVRPVRAF
jgi:uncharacterized protein (TIGR02145 family)